MTITNLAFLLYGLLCFSVIKIRPSTKTIVWLYILGWLLLPNLDYAAASLSADSKSQFPYWISGIALPTDVWITKAWVVPCSILLPTLTLMRSTQLKSTELNPMDGVVLFWCVLPLLQCLFINRDMVSASLGAAYLSASWGATWVIGRLYLNSGVGRASLVNGLLASGVVLLPLAIMEGFFGPFIYDWTYQNHPFLYDGDVRYLGFRPIGMFEHGNQYGLWVAAAAVCGFGLQVSSKSPTKTKTRLSIAIAALVGLLSQSVGAILLATCVCFAIRYWSRFAIKKILFTLAICTAFGGASYLSGKLPIQELGKNTDIGQKVIAGFKSLGRGSLPWRISQDQKTFLILKPDPILGAERWDWWRPVGTRPWGFHQLVYGQFGLMGLFLTTLLILGSSLRYLLTIGRPQIKSAIALPLVLCGVLGVGFLDAFLNSFIYFPMILISASLVGYIKVPNSKEDQD